MAKKYYNSNYDIDSISHAYSMGMSAPFDSRSIVETYDDLYTKATFKYAELYVGMLVTVEATQKTYVLSVKPKATVSATNWPNAIVWKEFAFSEDIPNTSGFATKEDLVDFLTSSDLDEYVKVDDIKDFITADALTDLAAKSDLEGLVKTEDLVDFLTASDLEGYATLNDIPTVPTKVSELTNDSGYLTVNDLPDFLTASDLDEYVKVDDIKDFITADSLTDLAAKSDLEGFVKAEDLVDFLTSSDLDGYAKLTDIPTVPTKVSELTNDAGYLTTTNQKFPNSWRTNGTMADLIKDINEDDTAIEGKAYFGTVGISDLPAGLGQAEMKIEVMVYDKSVPLDPEYGMYQKVITFTVTSSNVAPYHWEYTSSWGQVGSWRSFLTQHQDISGKANSADLAAVATSGSYNDLDDKPTIPTKVSDLTNDEGYVKSEDLPDYLLDSDLDGYAKLTDIPDVSGKANSADLAEVATSGSYNDLVDKPSLFSGDYNDLSNKPTIPIIPTTVSSFTNDAGYLTSEDEGVFPDIEGSDASDTGVPGYATVDGVVEYVNAYISELKKKGELGDGDYIYVNAVEYNNGSYTLTSIYQMNCFDITDDALTNEGMILHMIANNEKVGVDGEGDDTIEIYPQVLSIDVPSGYSIHVYGWNPIGSTYSNAETSMIQNPKGSTKQYGSKTYDSYARNTNPTGNGDYYNDIIGNPTRYKIIVRKK